MLASRDQENLVHGYQAAAAAKPLNQGSRQLAPKTPSNKASKTPFKLPLNDKNAILPLGVLKTAGKTMVKGNENMLPGSKTITKNAFTTPMGMALHLCWDSKISRKIPTDKEQDHATGLLLA